MHFVLTNSKSLQRNGRIKSLFYRNNACNLHRVTHIIRENKLQKDTELKKFCKSPKIKDILYENMISS